MAALAANMKRVLYTVFKYFLITLLVVSTLILGTCVYLTNFVFTPEKMCGTKSGPVVPSPNGKFKAVIYEFDCGAMDPFSTQISVLKVDEAIPLEGGNVFGSSRGARRGDWDGPYAEIFWLSDDHLLIRYISDTDVHQKENSVNGIKVSYETL